MKDNCIFCGKERNLLQRKKLYCGTSAQILCGDCYEIYKELPSVERAEAALKTGRAEEEEQLRAYLETVHEAREEKRKAQSEKDKKRISPKKCLRCSGTMLDYGPLTFKLGKETYFLSDLNRLISGSLTLCVLRCENCGKAEFYIPDVSELEALLEEKM